MQATDHISMAPKGFLANRYATKALTVLSDFRVQLLLVFLAAMTIRLLSVVVWDPGLEADGTKRVFYALQWLEDPYIFIPGVAWPPLHIYLTALMLLVYPNTLFAPILLVIFVGALTVVPLGFLVKMMFRVPLVAVLAAVIYAFYPLGIRYTLVAMPEAIYVFFICLGLWMLYLAREETRRRRQYAYVIFAALAMAGAGWTHLPPMWLIPIFGLLLWGRWGQLVLYLVIAIHPIVAFFIYISSVWGSFIPTHWISVAQSGGFEARSDLGDTVQLLVAFPNLLIHSLSVTLVILSLVGVLKAFQAPRTEWVRRLFPLFALLALVPAYILFTLLWSRVKPKETILLAVFMVPYAGLGLYYLIGLFKSWWERSLIVVATLALMFVGPYLGIFVNNWEIVPGQKAPASSSELVNWFAYNTDAEQAIIFDRFPNWQDWYMAIALRKGPDTVFLDPEILDDPVPVDDLREFVDVAHPAYLVLSKSDSTRLMPLLNVRCDTSGCPNRSSEPFLEAELEKVFETEQAVVYQLGP